MHFNDNDECSDEELDRKIKELLDEKKRRNSNKSDCSMGFGISSYDDEKKDNSGYDKGMHFSS